MNPYSSPQSVEIEQSSKSVFFKFVFSVNLFIVNIFLYMSHSFLMCQEFMASRKTFALNGVCFLGDVYIFFMITSVSYMVFDLLRLVIDGKFRKTS